MGTSLDGSLCVYFVISTRSTTEIDIIASEQYANALKLMREHLTDTQIREIRPSEGFPLIAGCGLTKKDVFVMSHFEGDLFEQLQTTMALVLGPPCIMQCIVKCEPIPFGSSPIYTTAMRDLHISASGVSSKEKDELKKLILWMGGHYFQNFGRNNTHLIANTIKSNKYEHATLNGVPVMHTDWVKNVWHCSRIKSNISATDEQFEKYRLPTFFGANITSSGLEATLKDAVMRLVNENGGIYHRAFRSQQVDIVITEQSKTDSEKYKAAVRFKKDVLLPEWIFDSHKRGYALPIKQYEVRPHKQVSTPTKSNANQIAADQTHLSDLSGISFVSGSGKRMCSDNTTVNETLNNNFSTVDGNNPEKQVTKRDTDNISNSENYNQPISYQQTLAEICPRAAKRAGSILDGCCINLCGFRSNEREKLNRVLNLGGATRYDDPHEGLTHIIVGQMDIAAYRRWQSNGLLATVQVVKLEWLLESIRTGRIANEFPYRITLPESSEQPVLASPCSKRTLRSMNHSFKQPKAPINKKLFEVALAADAESETQPDLLTHYSQVQEPVMSLPAASSTQLSVTSTTTEGAMAAPPVSPVVDLSASTLSIDFEKLDYFMGASVYVHQACFSDELYNQMVNECKAAQGCLVPSNYVDLVDYAIVSFEQAFDESMLPIKARYIVTELYLESCMKQNKLLPLLYYHRPVPFNAQKKPLRGLIIVVSIYAGLERDFINALAEMQGASLNKAFVKKERPLLVCSNAEGSKYEGAIKWGYPVVRSEWLLQCAHRGKKLPYDSFKVGNSANDFPISPRLKKDDKNNSPINGRPQSPISPRDKSLTKDKTSHVENKERAPQINALEVTPLRNPRVSELVTGLHSARRRSSSGSSTQLDSPHTPLNNRGFGGGGAFNFDFLEHVVQRLETSQARDCVRQIIREMRENQTPEFERIRRQACTPINRRQTSRPAPGIPNFCMTPEFQLRMAEDFERRWRLPKHQIRPDTPISVIRQRVMRITCEALGIDFGDEIREKQQSDERLESETVYQAKPVRSSSPLTSNTQAPNVTVHGHNQANKEQPNGSTINFDKISFEESASGNLTELKHLTNFINIKKTRRSSVKRDHEGQTKSEIHYVQPFESEGFVQTGSENNVDWRDPVEFNEISPNSDFDLTPVRHTNTPCFSISCGDDEKSTLVLERIMGLGGNICENLVNYDPACTHLLCERPNRGEKILACMAAGKWVLNINYIEQCHARGTFLDESLYEWGNPKALNLSDLLLEEQIIAVAAHRWRTKLSAGGKAFQGFHVILSLHERNQEAIKNVLRAGGACILEPETPFCTDSTASSATHCFMDVKKAPLAEPDLNYLQQHGVRIMSQMWINSYLMGASNANLEKYVLQK